MIHIKDIISEGNITRKQLNNRVVSLKNNYPNLIIGGGKGRGGKYKIHPLLKDFLIRPKSNINQFNNFRYPFPSFDSIELFKSIQWNWLCCYNPNVKSLETEDLLKMIPIDDGDICFYSIHETIKDNKLHIHFTIKTNKSKSYIEHFPKNKNNNNVKVFEPEKYISCYHYFSNTNFERNNQKLKEYGYIIGNKKN